MKISKKEDFALLFMAYLARHYSPKYISLSLVTRELPLSPLFLKHIVSKLLANNLIDSKEGLHGGYRLAVRPDRITIADIIDAISEGMVSPACRKGNCRMKKSACSCYSYWGEVGQILKDILKNKSLSSYAQL